MQWPLMLSSNEDESCPAAGSVSCFLLLCLSRTLHVEQTVNQPTIFLCVLVIWLDIQLPLFVTHRCCAVGVALFDTYIECEVQQ